MMNLCAKIVERLQGRTVVTAESITAGGIGAALTAISGSSAVYKGGIIAYTDWVKHNVLGVNIKLLEEVGAVSATVAKQMAHGARRVLESDIAVSVTGLAGPLGDEFGNSVGTVYIGYADYRRTEAREYHFSGTREDIRNQTIYAALELILEYN